MFRKCYLLYVHCSNYTKTFQDRNIDRNVDIRGIERAIYFLRHVHQKWGWLLSKSLQAINAGEGVEKREPSYTVGGNAN